MCKISSSLKLCTCAGKDVESLKHYWVLRRDGIPSALLVGEVMLPRFIDWEDEQYNIETLTKILNSGECFDVQLRLKDGDILGLHFTCKRQPLIYDFLFHKGQWIENGYDPFENGRKMGKGEIVGALEKR